MSGSTQKKIDGASDGERSETRTIIPETTKESILNPATEVIGQALSGVVHYVQDPLVRKNLSEILHVL